MHYRLLDGRVITCNLATGQWRIDGMRTTEAHAREVLYQEYVRRGLVKRCANCGSVRVIAVVRPRPSPGLRPGMPPPPATPYCLTCLSAMSDAIQIGGRR